MGIGGAGSRMTRRGNWSRSSSSGVRTDFGFTDVDADEKERLVREVFSSVADNYDVMNDFMSMGAHRLWKDELITMMGYSAAAEVERDLKQGTGDEENLRVPRHLDVAGGTGDVAFRSIKSLEQAYGGMKGEGGGDTERQVVVCDINPEMLAVGASRAEGAIGSDLASHVGFVEGNAEKLPFADNSFDLYTIAFGLRNVTNKDVALQEAHRVLRPGGRIMVLEFSHLTNPVLQKAYDSYSFSVIPKIGEAVANDAASYQYLVESIRRFPKQDELKDMMTEAGFQYCTYKNMTFGVVAAHSGFVL